MGSEVQPAAIQGRFPLPAGDDQERDLGSASAQLVGDPGEDVQPIAGRRVEERDVPRLAGLGPDAAVIDEVGEHGDGAAQDLVEVVRGESRGGEHGVGEGTRPEIARGAVGGLDDRGEAPRPAQPEDLRGRPIDAVGEQDVGSEPIERAFEEEEEDLGLGVVERMRLRGGPAEQMERDLVDPQTEQGRGIRPGDRGAVRLRGRWG